MAVEFSIIMMSYNYARFIRQAIDSVLAQTSDSWELIIVDDCSTDESWSVIQQYSDERILSFKHNINKGASAAYNLALSKCTGVYIACLDADDVYTPEKFKLQAAYFREHPHIDICGTFVAVIDDADLVIVKGSRYLDWFNVDIDMNSIDCWRWENHLCHSSVVIRREFHQKVGSFNENLVYTPDWQFWIRSVLAEGRFGVMHEPLVRYRSHNDNVTHKNNAEVVKEHAQTCVDFLLPRLLETSRIDLLDATLDGFICHPEVVASPELLNHLSNVFRSAKDGASYIAAIGRLASRQAAELAQFRLHYAQERGAEESDAHELAAIRPLLAAALDSERRNANQLSEAQSQLHHALDSGQKSQAELDEAKLNLVHSLQSAERQDKKIAVLQLELGNLRKGEAELNLRVTESREQLDILRQAEETKTKTFASVLATTQSLLESATNSSEQLNIHIATVQTRFDHAVAESDQKTRYLSERTAELAKAQELKAELIKELASKNIDLETAHETEQRLLVELEVSKLQLLNLRATDVQLRIQIKGLQDRNNLATQRRETREWEIAALTQTMSVKHKELKSQVANLKETIQNDKKEVDRILTDFNKIQQTLSWKVTRPLRYIRKLGNKFKSTAGKSPVDLVTKPRELSTVEAVKHTTSKLSTSKDAIYPSANKGVLLVIHELSRTGAPQAVHFLAKAIYDISGVRPTIISPIDGQIKEVIEADGFSTIINRGIFEESNIDLPVMKFIANFEMVVVTSLASFPFIRRYGKQVKCLTWWIHEEEQGFKYIAERFAPDLFDIFDTCNFVWLGSPLCALPVSRYVAQDKVKLLLYGCEDIAQKINTVSSGPVTFTLVGSVEPRKGQDIFLAAISKLSPQIRQQAKFRLIGSPYNEWSSVFHKEINTLAVKFPEVECFPNMTFQKLNRQYEETDVVVSASRADPMPISITQGLMFSKVCLCSSVIGQSGMLTHGVNGLIFENESYEDLAQQMSWLIQNKEKHAVIGAAGRRIYERYFSMIHFIENTKKLISNQLLIK